VAESVMPGSSARRMLCSATPSWASPRPGSRAPARPPAPARS